MNELDDGNIYPLGTQYPQIQEEMEEDLDSSLNYIHKYHRAAQQFFEEYQFLIDERQKEWRSLISCLTSVNHECLRKLSGQLSQEIISMESLIVSLAQNSLGELVFQLLKMFIKPVSVVLESLGVFTKNLEGTIKNLSRIADEQQIQYAGFFNMINKQLKSETTHELMLETITFLSSSLPMLYESEKLRILSYEKLCVEIEQDIYQNNEKALEFALEHQLRLEQFESTLSREYHVVFAESMEKMIPLEKTIKKIISSLHFVVPPELLSLEKTDTEQQEQLLIETHIKYDKHSPSEQEEISNPQSPKNQLEQSQQQSASYSSSPPSSPLIHSSSLPPFIGSIQKRKSKNLQKERDRYEAFFGISDEPFESYNCAFVHKILLQGKIHVFKDTLAFHSYFNAQSFVGSTALAIPFDDIISIHKRKSAMVFDTSIALSTVKGELLFTSFVARDSCFKLLSFLVEEHSRKKAIIGSPEQQMLMPFSRDSLEENESNHSSNLDEKSMIEEEFAMLTENHRIINENSQKNELNYQNNHKWQRIKTNIDESDWVKERQMNWQNVSIMQDCEKISELEAHFKGAHPTDVFLVGFSAHPFQKDSQIFTSFQEYLHLKCYNDLEVIFSQMSPAVPDWFGKEEIDDDLSKSTFDCSSEFSSARTITFIHPIKQKLFLGPKVSHCRIDETYYWISPHCFVVEREVFLSKIPYADYFTVRSQLKFSFNPATITTKMSVKFAVNFMKHTSFKNMIKTGSQTENMHQITQHFIPELELAVKEYVQSKKWRRNESFNLIQAVQSSKEKEMKKFFRNHSQFTGRKSSRTFKLSLQDMTVKQVFKMFFSDEIFTHPITKKIYPNFLSFSLGQQYQSDSIMIGMYSYSHEKCQTREYLVNGGQQDIDDLKKENDQQDRQVDYDKVLGVENVFWLSQKEVILERKDKIEFEGVSQGISCRIKEMKTKENEMNCQMKFDLFDVRFEQEKILMEIYQDTIQQAVQMEQQRKSQQCVHQSKKQAQKSYGCLNEQLTTYKAKMLESQEKIEQIEKEFDNQKKMSFVIKAGLIMLVVMEIIRFIYSR